MMKMTQMLALMLLATSLTLTGCLDSSSDNKTDDTQQPDIDTDGGNTGPVGFAPWGPDDDSTGSKPLALEFAAINSQNAVGQQDVTGHVCDITLENVGAGYDAKPRFLGFYVSNVKLITSDNQQVDVTLDTGPNNQTLGVDWNNDPVAVIAAINLLEKRNCGSNPNANFWKDISGAYEHVTGTRYKGVQFTLGLPSAINHAAPEASGPLAGTSAAAMHWGWLYGYVLLTYELNTFEPGTNTRTSPNAWVFHMGSTNCDWDDIPEESGVTCAAPNTPTIVLDEFTPDTSRIGVNLVEMLAGTVTGTCMSENTAMCGERFAHIDLPHDGQGSGTVIEQVLFSTFED